MKKLWWLKPFLSITHRPDLDRPQAFSVQNPAGENIDSKNGGML